MKRGKPSGMRSSRGNDDQRSRQSIIKHFGLLTNSKFGKNHNYHETNSFTLWMLSVLTAWSQQSVRLAIDHQLGGTAFGSSVTAQNDLGNDFRTERLQFYISQIELVHDGGQITSVPNTWFLVDANVPFDESLGSFSIGILEAIRFGIGVEQAANHLDPASYAMTHPLAPKNPSMH